MKNLTLSPEFEKAGIPDGPDASPFIQVRKSTRTGEKSLQALRRFYPGDRLIHFKAKEYLTEPNRFSVQLDENRHILLDPEYLQYLNHSCTPNVFFDLPNWSLICLRPISRGEELTFFYPSTEWSMSQGFECQCGAPSCLGFIRGALYVSPNILRKYRVSGFIQQRHLRNYQEADIRKVYPCSM